MTNCRYNFRYCQLLGTKGCKNSEYSLKQIPPTLFTDLEIKFIPIPKFVNYQRKQGYIASSSHIPVTFRHTGIFEECLTL